MRSKDPFYSQLHFSNMGQPLNLSAYFHSFHNSMTNIVKVGLYEPKKQSLYVVLSWDTNPRPQDGRRRLIYYTMTVLTIVAYYYQHKFDKSTKYSGFKCLWIIRSLVSVPTNLASERLERQKHSLYDAT